ncbi:MAG: TlpA disulfide reductase family protein [Actinomycetota bacterium]
MRWLGAGLVLVIAAGGIFLATRSHPVKPPPGPAARGCGPGRAAVAVGGQIPLACTVALLPDGTAATLAQIAGGKPLVINVWASWCGACIKEMPDFQKVYGAAGDQVRFVGLDLLGVDGESRSGAVQFSRQRAVSYPLAYDDGGLLYSRVSLRVLPPTTAFVRADGTLSGINIGQLSTNDLRQAIRTYLGIQVAA